MEGLSYAERVEQWESTFGHKVPEGMTLCDEPTGPPEKCQRCGVKNHHEFKETCDWQCQRCGKLTPLGESNLESNAHHLRTMCNSCNDERIAAAIKGAGLKPTMQPLTP